MTDRCPGLRDDHNRGAYLLTLELSAPSHIQVGRFGAMKFSAGTYVYVGSARRGLEQRVARHRRLARTRRGTPHWHIDYLLLHSDMQLVGAVLARGGEECQLAAAIIAGGRVSVPMPGFGASDCTHGCPAHLFAVA